VLLAAHRAIPGTCAARSVSDACGIERCSPQSVPFPPRPPPKAAALRCSAGSLVLRLSPTSPVRSCPPCGLWPSRTGLGRLTKTYRRSPGSRACCFSACAGSQTTQDRTIHSRLAWLLCCLPPLGTESASCSIGFSKLNSPAHRYLCLRFKRYLAISPARLEARMDSLLSFPVGLFHPLQHAGLSRRSPSCRPSRRNPIKRNTSREDSMSPCDRRDRPVFHHTMRWRRHREVRALRR
jgi:hypothetical protein